MSKRPSGIVNLSAGVRPPRPGETAFYRCGGCGELFFHKIPPLFVLGVKCPKCGSLNVRRDQTAAH